MKKVIIIIVVIVVVLIVLGYFGYVQYKKKTANNDLNRAIKDQEKKVDLNKQLIDVSKLDTAFKELNKAKKEKTEKELLTIQTERNIITSLIKRWNTETSEEIKKGIKEEINRKGWKFNGNEATKRWSGGKVSVSNIPKLV